MGNEYVLDDVDTCRTCIGKGIVEMALTDHVTIEKGSQEGDVIEIKE